MAEDILIKVEGLGKKFCKDLKKSLKYGVQDVTRSLVGMSSKKELRDGEFGCLKTLTLNYVEANVWDCLGTTEQVNLPY